MPGAPWEITLDQAHSTFWILASIVALIILLLVLFLTGCIQSWLGWIARRIAAGIEGGFRLWERTLAWARWPLYLLLVALLLGLGINLLGSDQEWASLLIAMILLTTGVSACTAFIFVSLERYDVSRGYKAVHNPAKGQELAIHVTRYGDRLGPPMLGISAAATIAGFALLNRSLYAIFGHSWYAIRDPNAHPGYLDFLAFSLIQLWSVVDILDLLGSTHFISISFVRKNAWPVSVLLVVFKSFFTLVLFQQIMAAIREQRLLWEMVADFWSPHAPIHERARGALSQFGPFTIAPLMRSLGEAGSLTREQRDELPIVLADLGPLAIPELMKYLSDERDVVRGVAAVALGRLAAKDAVAHLLQLCHDPHEGIRACAADALGAIGAAHASSSNNLSVAVRKNIRSRLVALVVVGGKASVTVGAFCWGRLRQILGNPTSVRNRKIHDPVQACREALQVCLSDAVAGVRAQAMIGLGRMGPSASAAAPDLTAILKTGLDQERVLAAEALGKVLSSDPATLAALASAVYDPVAAVRAAAAAAVGHYQRSAAAEVPALVALLDDPDESVRDAATKAIQEIGLLGVEATQALEERLAHPDNARRAQTAEALGEMGEAAQPAAAALVDSLKDENDLVRGKAAEALGRIGEAVASVAVPALVQSLEDQDTVVQARAAEALAHMGPQGEAAIPNLVKSLHSSNVEVRGQSAATLGQLRALEAREDLELACADDDANVRAQALRALGMLSEPNASSQRIMLAALSDAAPPVRAAAVEALAACGSNDEPVISAVANLLNDSNEEVITRVMRALPRFGDAALPGVFDVLCKWLADDANAVIPACAADALGQFGPTASAAGPALARAAQTGNTMTRQASLRALTRILPPEAAIAFDGSLHDAEVGVRRQASAGLFRLPNLPDELQTNLVEALRDPDLRVRSNAAFCLMKFESLEPEVEPLLVACAAAQHTSLRRAVAGALARCDSPRSRETLQTLLNDPDPKVTAAAEWSLAQLLEGAAKSIELAPIEPAADESLPAMASKA